MYVFGRNHASPRCAVVPVVPRSVVVEFFYIAVLFYHDDTTNLFTTEHREKRYVVTLCGEITTAYPFVPTETTPGFSVTPWLVKLLIAALLMSHRCNRFWWEVASCWRWHGFIGSAGINRTTRCLGAAFRWESNLVQ